MKTCIFDITTRLITRDKMTTLTAQDQVTKITTNCVSSVMQKINKVIFD